MDALCQAVESYWSVYSIEESRLYAGRAVKLVMSNLKSAVLKPTGGNRLKMAEASHLAGKAINISKTTAAHVLSYFFTTRFNVPHDHAAGLTLGRFFIFNFGVSERDAADERGADYTKGVIKDATVQDLSFNRKFTTAYNALQLVAIFLYCKGYKPLSYSYYYTKVLNLIKAIHSLTTLELTVVYRQF